MTGFPHAADDDPAVAVENQCQGLQKSTVDPIDQRQNGVAFDAQDLAGKVERL